MIKMTQNAINTSSSDQAIYLELLASAHIEKDKAYCRYSGFKVGAAVLTKDGAVITGCNVENASYGLTMCAERTALFNAVAKGYRPGDIKAIAIAASGDDFSPCGACRQVINEFGEDIMVIFEFGGKIVMNRLKELMPYNFKL